MDENESDKKTVAKPQKGDLTGIFDLPQSEPPASDSTHSFASEAPMVEQVDSFESIDQLGMMDHPSSETTEKPPLNSEPLVVEADPFSMPIDPSFETELAPEPISSTLHVLDQVKRHSEQTRTVLSETLIHYPFHLLMKGRFGPYERDKLLLFITENAIGLNSQELDLQIKSGRVLFPRISEYAGIKLIQDLRDSGLQFSFKPSTRDADDPYEKSEPAEYHFEAAAPSEVKIILPIIPASSPQLSEYLSIDRVQSQQFIKSQIVEVEKSEIFQEILDRMTQGLKQKARIKGGDAITDLKHQLVNLRLPSQYQVVLEATVLKRKS